VRRLHSAEKINESYVGRLLRLTLLAPDIVEAIVNGRQPASLQLDHLIRQFPVKYRDLSLSMTGDAAFELASPGAIGGRPSTDHHQPEKDTRRPTVATIELNRRFVQCHDDERSDPDLVAHFGRTADTLGWDDLIAKRRVVLLAEAGSGKTTEMKARARALAADGRTVFYATVEDVGRRGMGAALRPADRARLTAWRASEQDAWFFMDSVDEAKNSGVKLHTALQAIAESIAGAERRAHIVLSGIVIVVVDQAPALMRLTLYICLTGLPLGVERVELQVEVMFGRLAGVDRAPEDLLRGAIHA
jgi:hypothetical protein